MAAAPKRTPSARTRLKWRPIFGGQAADLELGSLTVVWIAAGGPDYRVSVFGKALEGTFSLRDGKAEAERKAAAWVRSAMRRLGCKAGRAA